ncbi:HDOD domain-containing protein [Salinimonas chungwhensis]|uniref:HDOD domain-containing protein n=1 Tax=Salinimonas chungwhensis TaxID=265425 RepID=UPI00037F43F4|nr:HDOD domain-containing protein [Salinimonas chungwhensis]
MASVEYHQLIQQSQIASKAIIRQAKNFDGVNAALGIAKRLIHFTRHHPQAALVAVNTLRQESGLSAPLPLRMALIMTVLGQRSKLNDHYLQHLSAAAYMLFCTGSYHKDTQTLHFDKSLVQGLKKQLKKRHLSIWQKIFAAYPLLSRPHFIKYLKSPALKESQWWALVSAHISIHFKDSFFPVLRQIALHSPLLREPAFTAWVDYPGNIWPGAQVATSPHSLILLAKDESHCALVKQKQGERKFIVRDIVDQPALRYVGFDQWWELIQRFETQVDAFIAYQPGGRAYPLSHPPSSLLNIVDLLHEAEIEIDTLVSKLEAEPAFANALKSAASTDNRMQLPVNDVKQAVLTFGLERVGDMLIREALVQRLTQNHFPLSRTCQNILAVSANLSSLIAAECDSSLTPQSASLISSFMVAPLFSLPALKVLPEFIHNDNHLHSINKLVALKTANPFVDFAAELASNWHLPAQHRAILLQLDRYPADTRASQQKDVAVVMLSLIWTRQWLFCPDNNDAATLEALRQCLHILSLSDKTASVYREKLSHLLYSALPV